MDGRVKKKPRETEYRKHIIIDEGNRVVIAKHGLYVTEFDSVDKAKEHLDNAC